MTLTRANRKNLITSKEKILLHLQGMHRYHQDSAAPEEVTQEGISEGIGVGRNNVSKLLQELIREGMVEVQTKHVKGLPRVRKAYFLTHLGFNHSLVLKEELESETVTVVDFEGNEVEDEVGRLNLYLPRSFNLLELASGVEKGVFDCSLFHEEKVKEERRYVDYSDRKPAVRTFYGREEELGRLLRFLGSGTAKVMSVHGIAGMGKTTLLAKFAQDARDSTNIFWYRMHEWVTLKILLAPLAEFLSQVGRKGLERYLAQTDRGLIGEVCSILETDLRDTEALIIIDDIQKGSEEIGDFLTALLSILDHLPDIRLIMASRELPSFYTRKEVFTGLVEELPLSGLDRESALQMLRARSLPEEDLEQIYQATEGHPLFLQLVEEPKGVLGKNVRKFIEQEVYSGLDLTERRILEIASVFRYPILMDGFFVIEEAIRRHMGRETEELSYEDYMIDYDTVDALLSKSLLQESMSRMIGMHDVVKDFFYSRLKPSQKELLHMAASSYYMEDSSAPSLVEALYHALSAGQHDLSVRIAASHGRSIVSKGYAAPLSPLIDCLLEEVPEMGEKDRMEVLLLQGQMKEIKGEWDTARGCFLDVLEIAGQEDRRIASEAHRRIGSIHLRRAEFDQAHRYLDRGRELAEGAGDLHTLTMVYYDLGGLAERTGECERALELFESSRDTAERVGDELGKGRGLYGIGRVYESLLEFENSVRFKRRALEALERVGATNEVAKVSTSLGNDLRELGDLEGSLKFQEKAIDLARSAGDVNTLGYALANAAASYLELDVLKDTERLIGQASSIFHNIDDKIMISTMHLYRGYLYCKRGEWEWAKEEFSTSLDLLRRLDVPMMLSHWLYEVGQTYLDHDDEEGARSLFREALGIADRLGHDNLQKDLKEAMGLLKA